MMWKEEYKSRFKPSGRIGRKDFFKNSLFIFISVSILLLVAFSALANNPQNRVIFGVAFIHMFILEYVWFCLLAKRMHDLGFRLWWLLLFIIVIQIISGMLFTQNAMRIAQGIDLLLLVMLFVKKGQPTQNKFGDVV